MRPRNLLFALPCLGLFALFSSIPTSAQQPASRPATQPSTQPLASATTAPVITDQMRHWFAQLADPQQSIRDQAQFNLMGISADQLPALRELVRSSQPLAPDQAAALHDIVMQVYLAGQTYTSLADATNLPDSPFKYFLGLRWPNLDDNNARLGIPVGVRLPGFPGFRYLREGDMILGVIPAEGQLLDSSGETHSRSELTNLLRSQPTVVLRVLRNGNEITLTIRLALRPADTDPNNTATSIETFENLRNQEAQKYFDDHFLPLIEHDPETIGCVMVDAE